MHHVVKDEPVTLRQLHVGCPSGKPNTVGTSYDCTIYAVLVHNGVRRGVRGTVTVHVEKGNKVGFVPTHDMHIHQL
jgi:hypothetical protein